jgi:hypothetical protein
MAHAPRQSNANIVSDALAPAVFRDRIVVSLLLQTFASGIQQGAQYNRDTCTGQGKGRQNSLGFTDDANTLCGGSHPRVDTGELYVIPASGNDAGYHVGARATLETNMTLEKPFAPHCERNQAPILEVLRPYFLDRRRVLEVGSGTGQHAVFFAPALPDTTWQTSDMDENLPGIRSWLRDAALPNLPPPLSLDVTGTWPKAKFDAAFTANSLHIMPWSAVERFFSGVDGVLEPQAMLAVYGPFNYHGAFTSDSNREFDGWLKQRSALSGIRDFEAVDALAKAIGLELVKDHVMPANNRLIIWRR